MGVGALDDGGNVGWAGGKRLGGELEADGDIGPATAAMRAGPLAGGLGDPVGVGRLVEITEMAIRAHQPGERAIALDLVAEEHLADRPHPVRSEHDDRIEVPVSAALIVGRRV